MTFEEFTAQISESVRNRFSPETQNYIEPEMLDLLSEKIKHKQVLRFCRQHSSVGLSRNMKTLLIVGITLDDLKDVLQWAALCKEILLDPETSDIYLFIFWLDDNKMSVEECLRIEANEDFCRKFVLRPQETIQSFTERTFLKQVKAPQALDLGQDPLISAFSGLVDQFGWFGEAEKARWKEAFGSGASGSDLFDALIIHKSESNEAS
jgi:hypothetical protein